MGIIHINIELYLQVITLLLVSTDINIYNIIYNVNVNNVKTIIRSR